jgi:hypothetical protein
MIFYRYPMQFMTHLADKHGTDAVTIELRPHNRSDLPDMGTVRAFHSSCEIRRPQRQVLWQQGIRANRVGAECAIGIRETTVSHWRDASSSPPRCEGL